MTLDLRQLHPLFAGEADGIDLAGTGNVPPPPFTTTSQRYW
jgi:hypothetical protein